MTLETLMTRTPTSLLCLLAIATGGCAWNNPPPDDAGDASWVLQAVPTLVGRNIASAEELEALVSLVGTEGRPAVADLLLDSDASELYWATVLRDALQLETGPYDRYYLRPDCVFPRPDNPGDPYDAPVYGQSGRSASIVAGLRNPAGALQSRADGVDDVSFSELLLAAVQEDALDVVMPAYLGISQSLTSSTFGEGQRRQELAERVLDRVVGRDMDCLGCHTGSFSVTGGLLPPASTNPHAEWNRHAPMPSMSPRGVVDYDAGLFDYDDYYGPQPGRFGGREAERRVSDVMHSGIYETCAATGCDPAFNPWGLRDSCFVQAANADDRADGSSPPNARVLADAAPSSVAEGLPIHAAFAGLHAPSTIPDHHLFDGTSAPSANPANLLTLSRHLTEGIAQLSAPTYVSPPAEDVFRSPIWSGLTSAKRKARVENSRGRLPGASSGAPCTDGCHNDDSFLASTPDDRIRDVLLAFDMCQHTNDVVCGDATLAWLRTPKANPSDATNVYGNAYPQVYTPPDRMPGAQSLAVMAARQLSNIVAEELFGDRLVLEHGFPRHPEQAQTLAGMTNTLVTSGWSLRAVLREVVTSNGFNRRDLAVSQVSQDSVLPIALDPWSWEDGATSGSTRYNDQGDLVHKASLTHSVQRVHHALGWPSRWMPLRYGLPSLDGRDWDTDIQHWGLKFKWGSQYSMDRMGGFQGAEHPEKKDVELGDWLGWVEYTGTCDKPDQVLRDPLNPAHPAGHPHLFLWDADWDDYIDALVDHGTQTGMPRIMAFRMLRERLLQDSSLQTDEFNLLWTQFGATTAPLTSADEANLRDYCGVLLRSPQFMLTGAASTADADAALSNAVPAWYRFSYAGEPVGVTGWCAHHGGTWTGSTCTL